MIEPTPLPKSLEVVAWKFHPIVVVDPWLALALMFWKPLLAAILVFVVLFTLVVLLDDAQHGPRARPERGRADDGNP